MKKEEIKDILNVLIKGDLKQVDAKIELIKNTGDINLFNSLVDEFSSFNNEVRPKIYSLFCDIKDQGVAAVFVDKIQGSTDNELSEMLLSAAWNSRLDFTDHLEVFIEIVTAGEFKEAFEAFTVIENVEAKVTAQRKADLVDYVKTKIGNCNDQTLVLAHDLIEVINNYEEL